MLTAIAWASLGRAGDAAQSWPLGFCAVGRYSALAQVGALNGSGLPDAAGAAATVAQL